MRRSGDKATSVSKISLPLSLFLSLRRYARCAMLYAAGTRPIHVNSCLPPQEGLKVFRVRFIESIGFEKLVAEVTKAVFTDRLANVLH